MLTLLGRRYRLCDGVSRRAFLQIGGLAAGGLTLADLLRAESQASGSATSNRARSVIMVFLPGGPSHIDLYDPKPLAPVEIRGPYKPIATRVAGIEVGEHLPRLAQSMDKLVLVRSVVGATDDHASHICFTGRPRLEKQPPGQWPAFGSAVSKLRGPVDPTVPPYIGLAARMLHPPYNDPGPGFLGYAHSAFTPDGQCRENMLLSGLTLDRLADRRALWTRLDRFRRQADATGAMHGMDAFHQQALSVLTSSRLAEALDISGEPPRIRERYGKGDPSLVPGLNAAPKMTEHLLMARRLVEAGARCVTLAFGAWDWHDRLYEGMTPELPLFDQGISALVEDLHERGLQDDVAVVVWGEFGRSPRINQLGGRDHWPAVSCALLAGGGLRAGQVIGSTNRWGEAAQERPVHVQEVLATLYHHLGIDAAGTTLADLAGRPHYLVDGRGPIQELL